MIAAYLDQEFLWVGVTEHMPPTCDTFLYPDEKAAGLTADAMRKRFARYVAHCRSLQARCAGRLTLLVGMETEAYTGALACAARLQREFDLDYIVGSVHHVADIPIDMDIAAYHQATATCGGIENLYNAYFDLQYDMMRTLRPSVVGHFDLIRIFDPDYPEHIRRPSTWRRILRNLEAAASLELILDMNTRAMVKGASEPYICTPILETAHDLGVSVVPGDDSHSVDTVGKFLDKAILRLRSMGFSTDWPRPALHAHHSF